MRNLWQPNCHKWWNRNYSCKRQLIVEHVQKKSNELRISFIEFVGNVVQLLGIGFFCILCAALCSVDALYCLNGKVLLRGSIYYVCVLYALRLLGISVDCQITEYELFSVIFDLFYGTSKAMHVDTVVTRIRSIFVFLFPVIGKTDRHWMRGIACSLNIPWRICYDSVNWWMSYFFPLLLLLSPLLFVRCIMQLNFMRNQPRNWSDRLCTLFIHHLIPLAAKRSCLFMLEIMFHIE